MRPSVTSDLLALPSAQAVTWSHVLAASPLLGCSGSQMILQALCDDTQHWYLLTHPMYQFPTEKEDQAVSAFSCSSAAATCNGLEPHGNSFSAYTKPAVQSFNNDIDPHRASRATVPASPCHGNYLEATLHLTGTVHPLIRTQGSELLLKHLKLPQLKPRDDTNNQFGFINLLAFSCPKNALLQNHLLEVTLGQQTFKPRSALHLEKTWPQTSS